MSLYIIPSYNKENKKLHSCLQTCLYEWEKNECSKKLMFHMLVNTKSLTGNQTDRQTTSHEAFQESDFNKYYN